MTLQQAQAQHESGRADRAEPLYRSHLAQNPDDEEGLYWLATLLLQTGRFPEAIMHYERALFLTPDDPDTNLGYSIALIGLSRFMEAEIAGTTAIESRPETPEAHYYLGTALFRQNRIGEAEREFREAIRLKPNFVEALMNLQQVLKVTGRITESTEIGKQLAVLKARGMKPQGLSLPKRGNVRIDNLPALVEQMKRQAQANDHENLILTADKILARQPNNAQALFLKGLALYNLRRFAEAEPYALVAVREDKNYAPAQNNLGNIFIQMGRYAEALEPCRRAIELRPDVPGFVISLGFALAGLERYDEAQAVYEAVLAKRPDFDQVLTNLGRLYLSRGNYPAAWKLFDRFPFDSEAHTRNFNAPEWDGSPQPDKTILLHMAEGIGDNLQYLRFLPMVKERIGTVILEAYPDLMSLVSRSAGFDQLVERIHANRPPDGVKFDVHLSLHNLPRVFRSTPETLPVSIPYVFPDLDKSAVWKKYFERATGLKVGIVWGGRPDFANDHNRSMPLSELAPLAELVQDGTVHLYSLQKGTPAQQLEFAPPGLDIIDMGQYLANFDDTAAAIVNLDIILTVDTSVAHLAGALGANTWVMLPFLGDWRWGLEPEMTAWYPGMRLFRQSKARDWAGLMDNVKRELAKESVGR